MDAFALGDGPGSGRAWSRSTTARRGPDSVTVAALRQLGAVVPEDLATVPVHGGDAVVGEVRAVGLS